VAILTGLIINLKLTLHPTLGHIFFRAIPIVGEEINIYVNGSGVSEKRVGVKSKKVLGVSRLDWGVNGQKVWGLKSGLGELN